MVSLMATITIPDDLHAALQARAHRDGRTLDEQIVVELANGAGTLGRETEGVLAARDRMRKAIDATSKLRANVKSFLSAEEIKAAIAEGRR